MVTSAIDVRSSWTPVETDVLKCRHYFDIRKNDNIMYVYIYDYDLNVDE